MNKKLLIITILFSAFFLMNCSEKVDTNMTIRNLAAGSVILNFRGEAVNVPAGQTVVLKALPRGTYEYSTTFSVPAGATTSSSEGELSGEVSINAGTKILLIFSSTLVNGTYTIFATISTNDDLTPDNSGTNP